MIRKWHQYVSHFVRSRVCQIDDFAHLHPAVNYVQVGRSPDKSPTSISVFGLSEPSEEQEEVAFADGMPCKMALGSIDLSESRPPTNGSRQRSCVQVWIEVAPPRSLDLSSGQFLDQETKGDAVDGDFIVCVRVASSRDGQWH
jgi:hypothetical protein